MTETVKSAYVLRDFATLLWPKVITPEAYKNVKTGQPLGEPAWSVTALLDPEGPDLKAIKAQTVRMCAEAWPGLDIRKAVADGILHLPWTTGEAEIMSKTAKLEKAGKKYAGAYDYMIGKVLLKTSAKTRAPGLAIFLNEEKIELATDQQKQLHKGKFYSGVLGAVEINLGTWTMESGLKYVKAYLQAVLSTGTGKQLGAKSALETFSGFAGKVVAEDPTKGSSDLDDEIPF
jgi:hypothetical protein